MAKKKKTAAKTAQKSRPRFTAKQGQYLAYLYQASWEEPAAVHG